MLNLFSRTGAQPPRIKPVKQKVSVTEPETEVTLVVDLNAKDDK
jgi:hypothetical protein